VSPSWSTRAAPEAGVNAPRQAARSYRQHEQKTGDIMTQQGSAQGLSGRALALARRKAMSSTGKAAVKPVASTAASRQSAPAPRAASVGAVKAGSASGRAASQARRKAMSSRGKLAVQSNDRVRVEDQRMAPASATASSLAPAEPAPKAGGCDCGCKGRVEKTSATEAVTTARPNGQSRVRSARRPGIATNPGRAASLARRRAQSSRGKAGLNASGMTAAQTARATNPDLSGRELARALREQRSKRGAAGQKKSEPCGRKRPTRGAPDAAQDAPWKVGASETTHGQTVTGTMVGRSHAVTGDEASTCRAVTGTEYMGADIFRDFCQREPGKGVRRAGVSPTARGNAVTGNEVGRSTRVTGDEPGTCKKVTGTEYVGADQSERFCGVRSEAGPVKVIRGETRKGKSVTGNNVGRSGKVTGDEVGAQRELTGTQYMQTGDGSAPSKVGRSATLRGGGVTGTMVGRREHMTGDEAGSCRDITGDDYIGQEQYQQFCSATPMPGDRKVGVSRTHKGKSVTGTMTGRSDRVTGDEPGTCKAITGTPYAGSDQYRSFCESDQAQVAEARMRRSQRTAGAVMTGQQPSVGGRMTGDGKGACETVSGTPYVGADQMAAACPAVAAEPGSPDFPQALGGTPWGQFSVVSPKHAIHAQQQISGVTGSRYEQGHITGPFGMAPGKVTGTEEARFGQGDGNRRELPDTAPIVEGRVKSRVTGEGIDAGSKITGDDWDRGDRVTGTEGTSAIARNQTRHGGPMSAMSVRSSGPRNQDLPEPVSKVTGGSGNTEKGALVTYSGGARG